MILKRIGYFTRDEYIKLMQHALYADTIGVFHIMIPPNARGCVTASYIAVQDLKTSEQGTIKTHYYKRFNSFQEAVKWAIASTKAYNEYWGKVEAKAKEQ